MYNEFIFKGKNTISLKPVSDEKNSLKISIVRIVEEWEKSKGKESFKRRIVGEDEEFHSGQMPGLNVIFKEKSIDKKYCFVLSSMYFLPILFLLVIV